MDKEERQKTEDRLGTDGMHMPPHRASMIHVVISGGPDCHRGNPALVALDWEEAGFTPTQAQHWISQGVFQAWDAVAQSEGGY